MGFLWAGGMKTMMNFAAFKKKTTRETRILLKNEIS